MASEPMTTPEPSPLSEQELKALEEYTWSLACCVCVGPDSDGNHDDDCQAPFWQKVSRAIAQARAARPSPWQPIETAKFGQPIVLWGPLWRCAMPGLVNGEHGACWLEGDGGGFQMFGATHWQERPAPPAQDGGRQ